MRFSARRLWGPSGDQTTGNRLAAGRSQRRPDLRQEDPPFAGTRSAASTSANIDAAFLHLYGLSRDDAAHILDTFPIVSRNDESRFGESRTKRVNLEGFDERSVPFPSTKSFVSLRQACVTPSA